MNNVDQEIIIDWGKGIVRTHFFFSFMAIIGGYSIANESHHLWLGYIWIVLIIIFCLLPGWRVYFTPPLKINPSGVSIQYGSDEVSFGWRDIKDFKLDFVVSLRGWNSGGICREFIKIHLVDDKSNPYSNRKISALFRRLYGKPDNIIPDSLEKSPTELIKILTEFKSKYGGLTIQ